MSVTEGTYWNENLSEALKKVAEYKRFDGL